MEENKESEREELMELAHKPVPGYRKIFFILLAICVLYLVIIFLSTF